jgi:prepilin-type N-terminal cleavage/methylation domain-containing protein
MNMRLHQRRRQKGTTLIELMVVVGIIGAISAMAVANLPRLQLDMRIGRAAHIFRGMCQEARGRALANRAFVRVSISAADMRMSEKNCPFGAMDSNNPNCELLWENVHIYSRGGEELKHVLVTPATGDVIYTPQGLLQEGNGSYQFYATTQPTAVRQTISVSTGGWVERN